MGNPQNTKVGMAAVVGVIGAVSIGTMFYQSRANSSGIVFQEAPKTAPVNPAPVVPQNSPVEPANATDTAEGAEETPEKPTTPEPVAQEIVVHITGAVKKPGVYRLPVGSRGKDAIEQAGGVLPGANSAALNLAAKLDDGSQLYIPTKKEEPEAAAEKEYHDGNAPVVLPEKPSSPPTVAKSGMKPRSEETGSERSSRSGSGKLTDPSQGSVNINTAGEEELQRLPGIGPAMAAKIVAFRQEVGNFQTPDDLDQVSGIGDKKMAKLRPFVKVK